MRKSIKSFKNRIAWREEQITEWEKELAECAPGNVDWRLIHYTKQIERGRKEIEILKEQLRLEKALAKL